MTTEPRLAYRSEQPYVAIRAQVAMKDIPARLPPLIPELLSRLSAQCVEPAGAPFFRYLSMDGEGRLQVDVGVPVATALPGDGRVIAGVFPAGRYATLTYTGPYNHLRSAWRILEDWKGTLGMQEASQAAVDGTLWGTRTEFYQTNPDEELDPAKWQTEIAFLVKDDVAQGHAASAGDEPESDLPAGLARPAQRALARAGYVRLEQFTRVSEADVLQLHGMGPKALDQIRRALAARGQSFAGGVRGDR